MGDKTNMKVRMTEAAGTPLGVLLTTNNPWGNKDCNCNQNDERIIDCKKRKILYESVCTLCNSVDQKKDE